MGQVFVPFWGNTTLGNKRPSEEAGAPWVGWDMLNLIKRLKKAHNMPIWRRPFTNIMTLLVI